MRRNRHPARLIAGRFALGGLAIFAGFAGFSALSACSTEEVVSNYTGLNLHPEWVKTLAIKKLPFRAVKEDGSEAFIPGMIDASTASSTTAVISFIYPIILSDEHAGERLTVTVDGLAEDGTLLATATATAGLRLGELFPLKLHLLPPSTCGDGRIQNSEACDDANAESGDGCSDTCTVEQAWICVRAPSRCFPESMTALVGPTTLAAAIADSTKPFVILRSGNYTAPLALLANSKTLLAQEGATLEVNNGVAVHIAGGGSVALIGLAIRGGGVFVEGPGSAAILEEVRLGPSNGVGAESSGGASLRVTRSRIEGNARGGIVFGGGLFRVESSVIQGNGSSTSTVGGIYIVEGTGASTIDGSTIVENVIATGSSTAAGVHCAVATSLANDIVFANGGSAAVSEQCQVSACDLVPMGGTPRAGGQPSISEDPKLSPDLHLLPTSPCIDAGETLTNTATIDIDGEPRPRGSAFDIGADEAG